jgi:hypothetical protein
MLYLYFTCLLITSGSSIYKVNESLFYYLNSRILKKVRVDEVSEFIIRTALNFSTSSLLSVSSLYSSLKLTDSFKVEFISFISVVTNYWIFIVKPKLLFSYEN